ncbi:hypothetical protein NBRC116594_01760 [Shimia sp. NS0008-38b]|uniref:hypothetical protein n=1 Tax=Shimia sp. NS0008-38b TaxID=3127653 RepID=UPI0031021AAA
MKSIFASAAVAIGCLSASTGVSGPSYGIGLTYVFGGDFALGFRVFHDDEPGSAVLAIGADYKFSSQAFRPTVGVGYLDEDYYLDFSLGYDTRLQALDYGMGLGASFETEEEAGTTTGGGGPIPTDLMR